MIGYLQASPFQIVCFSWRQILTFTYLSLIALLILLSICSLPLSEPFAPGQSANFFNALKHAQSCMLQSLESHSLDTLY